jgi:hypothetical protein
LRTHTLLNTRARRSPERDAAAKLARTLQRQRGAATRRRDLCFATGLLSARAKTRALTQTLSGLRNAAVGRARRGHAGGKAACE